MRPRIPPIGITVDMGRHGAAFKHTDWKIYREPGTPDFPRDPPPPPPAVPCRDATAEEIGPAAQAHVLALAAGLDVRTTYAQSGSTRRGPNRGKCKCGATPALYVESGKMFNHDRPQSTEPCVSAGLLADYCMTCGAKARPLKRGGVSKHYPPTTKCPYSDTEPPEILPGQPMPGASSVVVRIKGFGVGSWENGRFACAFVIRNGLFVRVSADDFIAALKETGRKT